jgi:hypothetical protein
LPAESTLTIIGFYPGNHLADIREKGLKIGRDWISGAVKVAHHLIEIVSETDQLPIYEPADVAARLIFLWGVRAPLKENRAAEVNRTHSDGFSAPLYVLKFALREA